MFCKFYANGTAASGCLLSSFLSVPAAAVLMSGQRYSFWFCNTTICDGCGFLGLLVNMSTCGGFALASESHQIGHHVISYFKFGYVFLTGFPVTSYYTSIDTIVEAGKESPRVLKSTVQFTTKKHQDTRAEILATKDTCDTHDYCCCTRVSSIDNDSCFPFKV